MSKYTRVQSKIWSDEKIRSLSEDGRMLFLYVLTSPHSNMAGFYLLPKPYVMYDLQWSMEQVDECFAELEDKGLISYCARSSVILIPNYFRYNPIQNKNQAIGANKRVVELPRNSLVNGFRKVCNEYAQQYYKQLTKGLGEGLDKGADNTEETKETENSNEDLTSESKEVQEDVQLNQEEDTPKFDEESKPYKAACYLRQKILENNNRAQVPNKSPADMEDWAVEMDRLNRLGPIGAKQGDGKGYTWQEIANIINWCQEDSFWKSNILSASKLRDKIVTLENQMKNSSKSKKNNGQKSNVEKGMALVEKLKKKKEAG